MIDMKFSKELLEKVRRGEATQAELVNNIMTSNPMQDILNYAVKQLVENVEPANSPISVTMEEYERIVGLFRIKGFKADPETGELIPERRGRKCIIK